MTQPDWLGWVARLRAIAQAGLELTDGPYDRERYLALRALATEIAAAHLELRSPAERLRLEELLAGDGGYPTPKVDVRALVRRGREVLLVRESVDGRWSLPGGWADVGETPAESAEREVYEESGYRVRAVRLISAYDRNRHEHPPIPYHVYKLVFLCEVSDETPSREIEAHGVGFFGEHELALPRHPRPDRVDLRAPPRSHPARRLRLAALQRPIQGLYNGGWQTKRSVGRA